MNEPKTSAPGWYVKFKNSLEKTLKRDPNGIKKFLEEYHEKQRQCAEKGHPGSKLMWIINNNRNADYHCPICGIYQRYIPDKEWEKHERERQIPYMAKVA
jgi:hypothetical protein